jgi:alpha-D-ribose 1-methylphosphonate 5-triphosphate synthase subunit PhnG
MPEIPASTDATALRRRAMAAFAEATPAELAAALGDEPCAADAVDLRPPEAGLVMIRGRVGGDGAAFNLGEATVARAAVRLRDGSVGHAYRLGRDVAAARLAAIADALWQRPDTRLRIERDLVGPVERRRAAADAERSRRAAATRVDFFTMVRGED